MAFNVADLLQSILYLQSLTYVRKTIIKNQGSHRGHQSVWWRSHDLNDLDITARLGEVNRGGDYPVTCPHEVRAGRN